jgi:hypothetical protein
LNKDIHDCRDRNATSSLGSGELPTRKIAHSIFRCGGKGCGCDCEADNSCSKGESQSNPCNDTFGLHFCNGGIVSDLMPLAEGELQDTDDEVPAKMLAMEDISAQGHYRLKGETWNWKTPWWICWKFHNLG